MSAELWAADGLADVEWVKPHEDGTYTELEAFAMIRAAYGKGYTAALSDPEPPTFLEAMDRSTELHLRLPV